MIPICANYKNLYSSRLRQCVTILVSSQPMLKTTTYQFRVFFFNNGEEENRRLTRSMTLQNKPLLKVSAPQVNRPIHMLPTSTHKRAKRRAAMKHIAANDTRYTIRDRTQLQWRDVRHQFRRAIELIRGRELQVGSRVYVRPPHLKRLLLDPAALCR